MFSKSKLSFFFSLFLFLYIFLSIVSSSSSSINFNKNKSFRSLEEDDEDDDDLSSKMTFNEDLIISDEEKVKFDDNISSKDLIDEMGFGWNLGNSLDSSLGFKQNEGVESETFFGNPPTKESLIDEIVEKGFKTIRIPITWHNHILDSSYTIDPDWMERVKEIVDWCIEKGLYVIINSQNDNAFDPELSYGNGYYPLKESKEKSESFLINIWGQISIAFNNGYDHHLIFECFNEPRLIGTEYEWDFLEDEDECIEAMKCINEYQKLIVETIRSSGGNNEKRFIMVTTYGSSFSPGIMEHFKFPDDSKYNKNKSKILLSLNMFIPTPFAWEPNDEKIKFSDAFANELYINFNDIYEDVILDTHHHVVITEMGAVDKDNLEERIQWAKYFIETARSLQIGSILWDNGYFGDGIDASEVFGQLDRKEMEWASEEFIETCIKAAKVPLMSDKDESCIKNFLNEPIVFKDWTKFIAIESEDLIACSKFGKFYLEISEAPFDTEDMIIKVLTGDWEEELDFRDDEIIGGEIDSDLNIIIDEDEDIIEIRLKGKNLDMVKEKGLVVYGHGVTVNKFYLEPID